MAFDDFEISTENGRPVSLYSFQYGNTFWNFCTADQDKTVAGTTYTAGAITDAGVSQGGSDQNDFTVTVESDFPVVNLFRNTTPSGKVWLNVRSWHIGDPDSETPLVWSGTVQSATANDLSSVALTCKAISSLFDRQGLRLTWGRMCPHVLYGNGCTIDKSLHQYPRVIASITGDSFTCVTHSNPVEGTFAGGFVELTRADASFTRFSIQSQTDNSFVMLGAIQGLSVGDAVVIYPGCARTTTACKLFNNLVNYGGIPQLPGKSPFDGNPVF